jgi:hypothetical protein
MQCSISDNLAASSFRGRAGEIHKLKTKSRKLFWKKDIL